MSVFEQLWYELPDSGLDGAAVSAWWDIRTVREQVNKKLEEQRTTSAIGSALAGRSGCVCAERNFRIAVAVGR